MPQRTVFILIADINVCGIGNEIRGFIRENFGEVDVTKIKSYMDNIEKSQLKLTWRSAIRNTREVRNIWILS